LERAAALALSGNLLKVINLTGHKLITGYPEGRRMWLNIRWQDVEGALLREDGAYGPLADQLGQPVTVDNPAGGEPVQVRSLLDLHDPNSRIYEAHYGMTSEWAEQLAGLGYDDGLVLQYDRLSGAPGLTLGQLRSQSAGSAAETFHFVLNNLVLGDSRIPPYGMDYDSAQQRNVLPVPATPYGGTPGGVYQHWDELLLNTPSTATRSSVALKYQPTSWEYIQLLHLANDGSEAFLQNEGNNLLDAWARHRHGRPAQHGQHRLDVCLQW